MIDVHGLCKDYTIKRKGAGLSGALKGLVIKNTDIIHAVRDLSFHIGEKLSDSSALMVPEKALLSK